MLFKTDWKDELHVQETDDNWDCLNSLNINICQRLKEMWWWFISPKVSVFVFGVLFYILWFLTLLISHIHNTLLHLHLMLWIEKDMEISCLWIGIHSSSRPFHSLWKLLIRFQNAVCRGPQKGIKGEDTTGQEGEEKEQMRDSRKMKKIILSLKRHNGIIRAVF